MRLCCRTFQDGKREILKEEAGTLQYLEGEERKSQRKVRRIVAEVDVIFDDNQRGISQLLETLERLRDVVSPPQTENPPKAKPA